MPMRALAPLRQRRIAHPEAGPHVLGEKLDGGPIRHWIGLRQISHSLY